jgi:hypothetical protein
MLAVLCQLGQRAGFKTLNAVAVAASVANGDLDGRTRPCDMTRGGAQYR